MKCSRCSTRCKKIHVAVHGAKSKAASYQCPSCEYFEFEQKSSNEVLKELRDSPLKIKHTIVKLSQERLGMYFIKHIIESLSLKKGEAIYASVPDEKHIVLEIK
ncbi:MAG: hypothetical protein OXR66_03465 [Candidatus Woesearchaeota archaeon]|nr:hypothetical protein [Candidatus Woesearchaeota archaeon]